MTHDDITRLAWSSKVISELAGLACLKVSDKHFDAEVLPREAVMAAVCKIRDATREGEAVIRTLAEQGKAGGVAEKYDDVLLPFVALMRAELHANSGKGDRPGWLRMSTDTCLLEIYYHLAKLQKAVRKEAGNAICEHAADVANMAMMLVDICGGLEVHDTPPANPPEAGVTDEMVERALAEWFSDESGRDDGPETGWSAVQKEYEDGGEHFRVGMRAALSAALAPQPKDAT